MPRGRHRHSPPLHTLLPPSVVAGFGVLCAAGAVLLADRVVLRVLVVAAAAVAVTGAVFLRSWDRDAGTRVADLVRARENDQWKTDERVAELENELEEAREFRAKLQAKLRAKRVELAGLRGEHAALLRRYATAETERATALEGRRQLALEAAAEPRALPPAGSTPSPASYLRAARALDVLTHNAEAQERQGALKAADEHEPAGQPAEDPEAAEDAAFAEDAAVLKDAEVAGDAAFAEDAAVLKDAELEEPHGKHAAEAAAGTGGAKPGRPVSAPLAIRVPNASAIVPYSQLRGPARPPGAGFDFFGTQAHSGQTPRHRVTRPEDTEPTAGKDEPAPAAIGPGSQGDPVGAGGEERPVNRRRTEERAVGQVIDLTEHDETEPLDMGHLRSAIGG